MRVGVACICMVSCGFGKTLAFEIDAAIDAPDARPDADLGVCTTAGLTCAQPAVMLACPEACWVGCRETMPFVPAKQRCVDWGGELMRVDTVEIQTCINSMFQTGTARWLGVEQAATANTPAEGWGWGNGAALGYDNWAGGQPNDANDNENGAEQCAYMSNPGGAWQDTPCSVQIGAFVCRR